MTEDAPAGRHRVDPPSTVPEPPPTGDLPVVRLPEAGAPPLSPSLVVRRLMFVGVLVVAALSVPVTVLVDFRAGAGVLAAALLMSSLARALLPAEYCLGLLVRSRRVDVLTSFVLAVAVFVCAWIVPSG
jgi:hypothetical protein